jgi:glycosyltransferase involved in cell wall biosynthesis
VISVIIPVYNRRRWVGRAIRSVRSQSLTNCEILVVDDGSTDGTAEGVDTEFGTDVRLLVQPVNQGVSAARNYGIRQSRGEWLAFLDSDDEWMPEKLSSQLPELSSTGYRVCHTNERWIRNGVRVNQHKHHQKHGGNIYLQALSICAMSPSSIIIHRSVFDDVGLFDEGLPACEDYELFLRVTNKYPVAYLDDELIVKYGGHGDQLSRAHKAMDRFRVYALDKILRSQNLSDPGKVAATRAMLLKKANIVHRGAQRRDNEELAVRMGEYLAHWR